MNNRKKYIVVVIFIISGIVAILFGTSTRHFTEGGTIESFIEKVQALPSPFSGVFFTSRDFDDNLKQEENNTIKSPKFVFKISDEFNSFPTLLEKETQLLKIILGTTELSQVFETNPTILNTTFEIPVYEPLNNNEFQGKLKIVFSQEDLDALKQAKTDPFSIVGIPAVPKSYIKTLPEGSTAFAQSIGPTYVLTPQEYTLQNPAIVVLCYALAMIPYSSENPLDESSARLWLGSIDGDFLSGRSIVNTETHCLGDIISTFPTRGIGIVAPQ